MNDNTGNSEKKVLSLLQKADRLLISDFEAAITLLSEAVKESRASGKNELLAASLAMAGGSCLLSTRLTDAVRYYKEAHSIYLRLGDVDAQLEMEYGLVSSKLSAGNEKRNLVQLHNILEKRTSTPVDAAIAKQSNFYIPRKWKDRILERIPSLLKIEQCRQTQIAVLYNSLARGYYLINEFGKSISYLNLELDICRRGKDYSQMSKTLNNLSAVYSTIWDLEAARKYAQQALKINRRLKDEPSIAVNLHNLANIAMESGQRDRAVKLATKALQMYEKLHLMNSVGKIFVFLAESELKFGSLAKASSLNMHALDILSQSGETADLLDCELQQLLIAYKRSHSKKIVKSVIALYEKAKANKQMKQYEIAKEIVRIAKEHKLHSESLQWMEIVHENEINKVKEEQNNAIWKIEIEQELAKIEQESKIQKLKMQNLELELKAKTNETEFLAAQLAKKSSVFAELTSELRTLEPNTSLAKAIELIESIRFRDLEYEQLEKRVQSQQNKFIIALEKQYPSLTSMEKKVCVLLKTGLKPADIASILFISRRTVETHCLSIRKKLNLSKKVRLLTYFQQF